jgi:hypothetical protein
MTDSLFIIGWRTVPSMLAGDFCPYQSVNVQRTKAFIAGAQPV